MKRIALNLSYIFKLSIKWTGAIFAFAGVLTTFAPLSDLLSQQLSPWCKILISACILVGVWIAVFIACSCYVLFKRRIKILTLNGGHHVYVQYGNVFSADEVLEPGKKRSVVIPVNRCFDTIVDNDLISSASLHGQAMLKLYASSEDRERAQKELNEAIKKKLDQQNLTFDTISRADKRKGNLERYKPGSVAEIRESDNCTYFFLGLTEFDRELKASVSPVDYVTALMKMIEFCNRRSQGHPVVMPVVGGGLARLGKSERRILEYLVQLLKLFKELINCDIHIVVWEGTEEKTAITDL